MNDIIIAILSSSAIATIVVKVIDIFNEKKKGNSLIEKAVMSLLGMEIRKQCEWCIRQNKISLEHLEQVNEMNILYKQMGGNGYVKALLEKVGRLPIKED